MEGWCFSEAATKVKINLLVYFYVYMFVHIKRLRQSLSSQIAAVMKKTTCLLALKPITVAMAGNKDVIWQPLHPSYPVVFSSLSKQLSLYQHHLASVIQH
jgi:hypothetical protein